MADDDFQREIGAHIRFLEEEFLRRGESAEEARRNARLACGSIESARQSHRDERSILWIAQAKQDLRHAFRSLRRSPGFAAAAILTLALGIGANAAVFSVIDAVLLRPLGYPNPNRIVQFFLSSPSGLAKGASIPDFRFWLEHAKGVENISAYDFGQSEMGLTSGTPEEVHGIHVTSNYFRLFGAPVLLGRTFNEAEDSVRGPQVVVLSYDLWKRRFSSDEHIVGKEISLDKERYTVIGVTGASFRSEPDAQLWIPFHFDLNSSDQLHSFGVAARLKPGITLVQANAQLDSVSLATQHDSDRPDPDFWFELRRFRDVMVGDVRSSLLTLQGAVSLVLLIACANLANLFLIRMTVRRREFAIRTAIGAGRGRMLRQLTTESLVLCLCGCLIGVVLGMVGVRALLASSPGNIPLIGEAGGAVGLDWRVLGFAIGISLLTGLVFGVFPALAVSRREAADALRETDSRQGIGIRSRRTRSVVVISEVALSLILLIGASLLIRTFVALSKVDPGFDPHHVVLMTMPLQGGRFSKAASVASMVREATRQIAAIPGVESSAATFSPPFASRMGMPFTSVSSGATVRGDGEWVAISPGYFQVLEIPIIRGRNFDEQDDAGSPAVVLINEAMAKRYWPGKDPIGQRIEIGKGLGPKFADTPRRIIGVVADTRDDDLSQEPQPTMMIPDAQEPDGMVQLWTQFGPIWWLIRTRGESQQMLPAIAEQLRQASGGRPVGSVSTMDEVLSRSIARQKFNMLLLTVFALTALLLAAVGVYGVMAYSVAQRTHEIGVRMALGADRDHVRNMILWEGLIRGLVGVACGACAAAFLVRMLQGLLFGVSPRDPTIFVAAPIVLVLVTIVAAWVPARRAARLDPIEALRFE
jgi:predicted permease